MVWLVAAGDFAACLKELLFVLALGTNTCEVPGCPQRPSCTLLPDYLNSLPQVFIMCLSVRSFVDAARMALNVCVCSDKLLTGIEIFRKAFSQELTSYSFCLWLAWSV